MFKRGALAIFRMGVEIVLEMSNRMLVLKGNV